MLDGAVTDVIEESIGTDLDSDVSAGATTIYPTDIDVFKIEGGTAQIGDPDDGPNEPITYTVDVDADGEPIGTLTVPALSNSYTADDSTPIILTENGNLLVERYAYFFSDSQDEEQRALIPTGMYDRLPLDTRDDSTSEWVISDYNFEGQLVLQDIDAREPVQSGEFLQPDTIPYQADGVPPLASPAVDVVGGPSFLGVTWDAITNADPVTYEVHISTSTGFVPDATTQVALVWEGRGYVITQMPDGSDLLFDTTYYVQIVATDIDGSAPPGTEGSGQLVRLPSSGTTSDTAPPGSSPTPVVQGGPGFLFAKWTPVANNDPVTYEVHISTVSGFTPGPGTLFRESIGSSIVIDKTAGGSALAYGTTYYVVLVAKDSDGPAAPSAQGSGALVQIGQPDVANLAIGTAQIQSLAVTDAKINTLSASKLTAGTIDASVITVTNLNATNITTGTLNASVVSVINLDAANITTGNISSARMQTNVLTALKVNVSQLDAIAANLGVVTSGIFKTNTLVTWGGSSAGIIISATDNGIRSFNGTQGTYELRGSDGAVAVGALLGDTGKQRIEILPTGMSLYEGSAVTASPPATGGGTNAALAWTTLNIAAVGATQSLIASVSNVTNPTVTTATNHGLVAGDVVEIRGLAGAGAANVNGYRTVATAPTGTTFTITMAAPGVITASTGAVVKVSPKGQFTTGTDTAAARMWFDYQGLHSQYQDPAINQGAAFRAFDFNPADASGLRLHTDTTQDAIRVTPYNGIVFKLAATDDPLQDLAARWVRQGSGALAAKIWGDNLGDDTLHGQINAIGCAVSASGIGQAKMQGQVGTSTTPTYFANVICTANFAGASAVIAKAQYAGGTIRQVTVLSDTGTSGFIQGSVGAGTGISVTTPTNNPSIAIDTSVVPRLNTANTFTAQQQVAPSTDIVPLQVLRGTNTSPTASLTRWLNFLGGSVLAQITATGRGDFSNDGLSTKAVAGAVSDASFAATPISGTLAVDTTNSRLYVRVGSTWKSVVVA